MQSKWLKRGIGLVVLALVVAGAVLALRPQPVPVDIATVGTAHLAVTVDEEGIARIRDVFRVSAPVAGRVERLPVEVGDKVHRNTTTVAPIQACDMNVTVIGADGNRQVPFNPFSPYTSDAQRSTVRLHQMVGPVS